MKLLINFLILVIFTNIALSEWELRYNADNVRQFASDGNKMYIGRNNGMTIYDFNKDTSLNKNSLNSELPGNYINTLLPMPDNTILVSTNGGLAVIENGIITKDKPICSSYPDNDARDLYKDSSGNIWTFSSHKVHKYSNGVWKSYDLSDSVKYAFDIAKLYIFGDKCWALFNDNTKTARVYYFPPSNYEFIKIAIITDTGNVKLFQNKDEFPYYDNGNTGDVISLTSANQDVYLKNPEGVYFYHDTTWTKTDIFEIYKLDLLKPYLLQDIFSDKNGNIWSVVSNFYIWNNYNNIAFPVSYNVNTGIVTEHLSNLEEKWISNLTMLEDGTIIAQSKTYLYFYNDTGWTKISIQQLNIPDSINFSMPKLVDGKKYVKINYDFKKVKSLKPGSILCLDDNTLIVPENTGFPCTSVLALGINKNGKGMFKGRNTYNLYESDSGFVKPNLLYDETNIKPSKDGFVYFTNLKMNDSTSSTPFLTTWEGNELKNIDMGFVDKTDSRLDFDAMDDYLIALGQYYYAGDSINSYVSIYNTTNGNLLKFDKYNSCLPDYYLSGIFGIPKDTVPYAFTTDNNLNVWIVTYESFIKFNMGNCTFYDFPKRDSIKNISVGKINFDLPNNELLISNYYNKFYYFDIATEKWDSIKVTDAGFIGNYVAHKKLLDNNVWACDDLGYMYRYTGKGHFTPYNLQVNGKPNLGFRINDFSIDANNYLHLGTDIGLLTNKTILTGIEDNTFIDTEQIFLMPNPATDYLYINSNILISRIEIFSIL
ncbi:MAG: hypothetical protein EPN82_08445, partial [Bacteroidetes bacterium]